MSWLDANLLWQYHDEKQLLLSNSQSLVQLRSDEKFAAQIRQLFNEGEGQTFSGWLLCQIDDTCFLLESGGWNNSCKDFQTKYYNSCILYWKSFNNIDTFSLNSYQILFFFSSRFLSLSEAWNRLNGSCDSTVPKSCIFKAGFSTDEKQRIKILWFSNKNKTFTPQDGTHTHTAGRSKGLFLSKTFPWTLLQKPSSRIIHNPRKHNKTSWIKMKKETFEYDFTAKHV